MKQIFVLILSLSLLAINKNSFGQDSQLKDTTTPKTDSALSDKVDKLTDAIQQLADKIKNDTVTSTNVGEMTLFKTEDIQTYTCKDCRTHKDATTTKIKIAKVVIDVRDGVIRDIQVFTDDGRVFSNDAAPIELNRFNERCDLLSATKYDGNQSYRIQTCDFLSFERMGSFIPNDTRVVLTKDDNKKTFAKDVGINSIFNIRLYSDLLGTFGNKPNGLVQTDADIKTPLVTTNFRNSNTQWLNYFTFHFNLSKFDNKFQNTALDSSFKRIDFYQRSWLTSEIGFNILSGNLTNKSNNRWGIDLIGGISLSNAISRIDSVKSDSSTILLPYFGLNPSLSIKVAPNIFINLSSKMIWQYAPKLKDSSFGGEIKIISPELELAWNPFSSPGSKIFGRVRYVQQFKDNNPFYQFQTGYNLSLNELINKKVQNK